MDTIDTLNKKHLRILHSEGVNKKACKQAFDFAENLMNLGKSFDVYTVGNDVVVWCDLVTITFSGDESVDIEKTFLNVNVEEALEFLFSPRTLLPR